MESISQWRYTSNARKDQLLARYNELTEQDAIEMGMQLKTLKRRLREYRATPRPTTQLVTHYRSCLLYTSDAPADTPYVVFCGRHIVKQKQKKHRKY